MEIRPGTDRFESIRRCQWRLLRECDRMSLEFGFVTVNASESVEEIQVRVRRRVQTFLHEGKPLVLAGHLEAPRPFLFDEQKDAHRRQDARPERLTGVLQS